MSSKENKTKLKLVVKKRLKTRNGEGSSASRIIE